MRLFLALILLLLAFKNPADAATFNCRDTSYAGFALEAASLTRQWGRIGPIQVSPSAEARWKRQTDVVAWLREPAPTGQGFIQRGAMVNAWAALMCLARRDGNPEAVQFQRRWSEAIGRQTDGFTVARAVDFYLDRLNRVARDSVRHLSAGERQLITETLDFLARQLGSPQQAIRDRLRTVVAP